MRCEVRVITLAGSVSLFATGGGAGGCSKLDVQPLTVSSLLVAASYSGQPLSDRLLQCPASYNVQPLTMSSLLVAASYSGQPLSDRLLQWPASYNVQPLTMSSLLVAASYSGQPLTVASLLQCPAS